MERLEEIWGSRRFMNLSEFSTRFFSHPNVPDYLPGILYRKACNGLPKLTFENFSRFVTMLTSSRASRQEFFDDAELENDIPNDFIESGMVDDPSTSAGNNSLLRVLSGVTHFDDEEIAVLEEYFSKICDKKTLKITKKGFHQIIKGVLSNELVDELFKVFNESRETKSYNSQFINFKEFVCGLSTMFLGPHGARINFIVQMWDNNKDGILSKENVQALLNYFNAPTTDNILFTKSDDITILDFLCWIFEDNYGRKLAHELISLTDQIKCFSFGFPPSSDREMLELVCDARKRVSLKYLDEWCIIPSIWWSKLIISVCPRTHVTLNMENYDDLLSPDISDPKNDTLILRSGLCLKKNYELLPMFLWNALCKWTYQDCVDSVVQRCCLPKTFVPVGGWPTDGSWGEESDFPNDHFVELYPPLVQFLKHSLQWNPNAENIGGRRYTLWRTINLSRSLTIGKLSTHLANTFGISPEQLRLWSLKIDGMPNRKLLCSPSHTLHSLDVLSTIQFLIEIRNADLSWPEELAQFHDYTASAISRENSDNYICNKFSEDTCSTTDCTINVGEIVTRNSPSLSTTTTLGSIPTPAGVINMGNTCYMSAGIQSISNISMLSEYLLNLSTDEETEKKNSSVKHELITQYEHILNSLLVKNECIAPKKFKELLSQEAGIFGDRIQHDCQEFLQIFLGALHKELNVSLSDNADSCDEDQNPTVMKSNKAWREHIRREKSIITELFDGQLQSSLHCTKCNDIALNFEVFSCVQLSLPVEKFLFIPVKIIKQKSTSARKVAVRAPLESTLHYFKQNFYTTFNIDSKRIIWLFLDKFGKAVHEICGMYDSDNTLENNIAMKALMENDINIFAYEYLSRIDSEEHYSIAVNRIIKSKATYSIRQVDGVNIEIFGIPLFVKTAQNSRKINGDQLYENVMESIDNSQIFFNRKIVDYNDNMVNEKTSLYTRVNRALDANEDARSGFPFDLTVAESSGVWCKRCHWTRYCRGCIIEPSTSDISDLDIDYRNKNNIIAINWKSEALYLKYDYTDEMVIDVDESFTTNLQEHLKPLSLDDCFKEFIKSEIIEDSKCEKCNKKTDREKSLQFCRFPKTMIIHLKRFVYVPDLDRHVKCEKPVTFPLDNFHPSAYMAEEFKDKCEYKYRCISIVNHHGEMNCGHYTSYIRRGEQWYYFNDSLSKMVAEESIDNTDAYLLFYERC